MRGINEGTLEPENEEPIRRGYWTPMELVPAPIRELEPQIEAPAAPPCF